MKWAAVKAFFSANVVWVVVAAFLAGGGVLLTAVQWGKDIERGAGAKRVTKQVGRAHAIEDKNRANLRDGDAVLQLQQHWCRDR